jgi:hypothetical protein
MAELPASIGHLGQASIILPGEAAAVIDIAERCNRYSTIKKPIEAMKEHEEKLTMDSL